MAVVNVHQKRRAGDAPDPARESYAQVVQSLDKLRWYYRFEEDAEGPFEPTVGSGALEVHYGAELDPVSKVPSAHGQLGEAITTAGYSFAETLIENDFPSGNSMSMGLWVKIPVGGGVSVTDAEWVTIWRMHSLTIGRFPWESEDRLEMHVEEEGESGSFYKTEDFPTGPNYLPHDTWAFYGFVFGPELWSLYLNGEKIGEQAVDAAFSVTEVGYASIALANGAVVDEVFASATALTDQQWADLYAAATLDD